MCYPKNLHNFWSVFSVVPHVLHGQDLELGAGVNDKPNAANDQWTGRGTWPSQATPDLR